MAIRKKPVQLTHRRLLEVLTYNPDTGLFHWRVQARPQTPAGSRAGSASGRYRHIIIDQENLTEHRLAYFYMTGQWPERDMDHRDKNKHNNKWENIRPSSRSQNMANMPGRGRLPKGVRFHKGRYDASIKVNYKANYLGRYDTPEEAHAAYLEAAKKVWGDFVSS